VHVAGTKGKGTVCAYVDSILSFYQKSHGLPKKIGLFTSPHLISVRERIRINSKPISETLFTKYFFEVWDLLEASAESLSLNPSIKPAYFRFLTLMSFYVFLNEGVDAAIYEVGIGGEYDSTNIFERPAATGISSLGIDHVYQLGESIDKIAWHKAGILKTKSPAFTVEQVPEAMEVVKSRAREKEINIKVVQANPILKDIRIQPNATFQIKNASLAIALTETVLKKIDPSFSLPESSLPKEFINGLEQVVSRGRFEIKIDGKTHWYLDGAHTADSLIVAAKWFASQSSKM
jgi:folylpolyglutamate synthase